jgi:hypothetical protein
LILVEIEVFFLVTTRGSLKFGSFGPSFATATTPSSSPTGAVFAFLVLTIATFTARGGGIELAAEIVIEAGVFRGGGNRFQGRGGLGTPGIVQDVFLGETLAEFVADRAFGDRRPAAWGPAFFAPGFVVGKTFVAAAAGGSTAGAFAPFGAGGAVFTNRSVFACRTVFPGGSLIANWPVFPHRMFFTHRAILTGRPLGAFFSGRTVSARTTVTIARAIIPAATAASFTASRAFPFFGGGGIRDDPAGRLRLGPRIVPVPFLKGLPELVVAGDRLGRARLVVGLILSRSGIDGDRRGFGSGGDRGWRRFRRRGGDRIGKIEIGIDVELDPQQVGGQFAPRIVVVFG